MFHNYRNKPFYALWLFLACAVSIAYLGCDKLVPTKFKAQNYNAPSVDQRAGILMTADTINDAQGNTTYYQYVPGPPVTHDSVRWTLVFARTLGSFSTSSNATDNQIINTMFTTLTDSLPSLASDTLIMVRYPGDTAKAANDTISVCYATLKTSQPEDIYLYTSLEYYYVNAVSNVADYVSVDFIKEDTSLVSSSTAIPSASTYASTETILGASNNQEVVPVLAARFAFHLDAGAYMVRFTLSNPAEISNPQKLPPKNTVFPAISNEFKVVILPQ